jgi:hypothetical protein
MKSSKENPSPNAYFFIITLSSLHHSLLEEERILQAKTTDGEQTNMQPQDETDETNDMLSVLR